MRDIEECWRREGKPGAIRGVLRVLEDNVTHRDPFGYGRCTIAELDRAVMRTIGVYVGVIVGEAKDAYDLIEKLKVFDLYALLV